MCNQWKYGRLQPPAYDLGKVNVPLALISGARRRSYAQQDCRHFIMVVINALCDTAWVTNG